MSKSKERLVNQTFTRLTVIEYAYTKNAHYFWKCICECGTIVFIEGYCLTSGNTKSCGCLSKEVSRENAKKVQHIAAKSRILPDGVPSMNALYGRYRFKALSRKLEFLITIDQFKRITKENCYYCDIEPKQSNLSDCGNRTPYIYNGIDRLDNTKGYIDNNCVPCCRICNQAKSTLTEQEFLEWVKRVYNHSIKDKE